MKIEEIEGVGPAYAAKLSGAGVLTTHGRGVISCLELPAVQERPKLFSTALMWLLAELFEALPEIGDVDKPKLVFIFDEAHLLFDGATKACVDSVTQTVRMIRSKGVGVFFITQTTKYIPGDVLGQFGNRIQHALQAFTPDHEKALRETVKTYPKSSFYDIGTLLTTMGIGEAAVTILSESGVPTPVVHTRLEPPKPTEHQKAAAAAAGGGLAAVGKFLTSRQGQSIEKQVLRGVFGMLKKR
jgi:DNA helicase HerA-like ATPase